ncbi:MAG: hypothetical protein R3C39_00390 [Dehalococcoidia bacterium]
MAWSATATLDEPDGARDLDDGDAGLDDGEPIDGGPTERVHAGSVFDGLIVTASAITLGVIMTATFLMFLLIEPSPRWVVLFGSAISVPALAGILQGARREAFEEGGLDVTPSLLLPALAALVTPVFIEHNVTGYWTVAAGLGAGAGYTALLVAVVSSVREHDRGRAVGRFIAAAATYFVAFAVFSMLYRLDVERQPATLAAGLAAALLAVELLRQGEIDPVETFVLAIVVGVLVAQVRWTMHYLPVDGYAAGPSLLLAFYFGAGVLHAQVTDELSRRVVLEYGLVSGAGLAFVIVASASGLG